ncbi:hypothetical protein EDB82DRAFT_487089 [Fusarium venenatum]|uniref:uncharacterized protein n=1 Tax=Fusarium venenatum TaxID=56646 RepID=UPI001D597062|nr:hypothetical protein EDB82DRAFT_487089 [Fusarium venenatum]
MLSVFFLCSVSFIWLGISAIEAKPTLDPRQMMNEECANSNWSTLTSKLQTPKCLLRKAIRKLSLIVPFPSPFPSPLERLGRGFGNTILPFSPLDGFRCCKSVDLHGFGRGIGEQ